MTQHSPQHDKQQLLQELEQLHAELSSSATEGDPIPVLVEALRQAPRKPPNVNSQINQIDDLLDDDDLLISDDMEMDETLEASGSLTDDELELDADLDLDADVADMLDEDAADVFDEHLEIDADVLLDDDADESLSDELELDLMLDEELDIDAFEATARELAAAPPTLTAKVTAPAKTPAPSPNLELDLGFAAPANPPVLTQPVNTAPTGANSKPIPTPASTPAAAAPVSSSRPSGEEENPFLPAHLREKLRQSKAGLAEEIQRSTDSVNASSVLLKAFSHEPNKSRERPAQAPSHAEATPPTTLIDELVAQYLPIIEAELRKRLAESLAVAPTQ